MREFWLVFHYKSDSIPNIFYDKKEAENGCLSAQKAGHPRAFIRHCWTKEVADSLFDSDCQGQLKAYLADAGYDY